MAAQVATAPVLLRRDPLIAEDVARWSNADKFGEAMRRSLPRLGPEAR